MGFRSDLSEWTGAGWGRMKHYGCRKEEPQLMKDFEKFPVISKEMMTRAVDTLSKVVFSFQEPPMSLGVTSFLFSSVFLFPLRFLFVRALAGGPRVLCALCDPEQHRVCQGLRSLPGTGLVYLSANLHACIPSAEMSLSLLMCKSRSEAYAATHTKS
eukprot:530616-Rhodomonas_salina.8